jgi:glycosyltransferase involved in cell wall biosynthesis
MYKFRSMLPPAPAGEYDGGPSQFHAAPDSPRHTPFGQFIRRVALDELPQLWNVLKGDMSLIGPRPEMPEVAQAYDIVDHPRHLVRPGMTGAWQVSEFRDGFVHMHVHIDAAYVGNLTLRQDLTIAVRTIGVVLGGGGEKIRQDKLEAKEAAEAGEDHDEEIDLRDATTGVRPVRVLHVLEPSFSGVPAYVEELGRGLAERGVEQVVLTSDDQEWDFEDWPVEVIRRTWRRRPVDSFRVSREIRHIVEEHDIDLVHAHATFAGFAARVRRLPVPLLYQPHGWGHLSTRRRVSSRVVRSIERALDGRADVLLTLSEQEAADSPRRRSSERVRPIVDLSRFGPLSDVERRGARLEYGWAPDQRVHLCVGELSHRKNQIPLASGWRQLAGPSDRLVFVGDGAARAALEATDERVHIMGWRDDIPRLMAAADTLVVPSLGEGFSLVILEALASGLPVFTTPVGGSEAISGNDGAIRGSVDDVVRAAVSSTLPDCEPVHRVLRAQRHQASASVDTVADDFVEIYFRTLDRPARGDAVVDLTAPAEDAADVR